MGQMRSYEYSRSTYERLRKLSIGNHRAATPKGLTGRQLGEPEKVPLRFLAESSGTYGNNLNMIKCYILAMHSGTPNYQMLSDEDKKKVALLWEHEDVVDIVMATVFQWFGTSCGRCDMGELMKKIDESLDYGREAERRRWNHLNVVNRKNQNSYKKAKLEYEQQLEEWKRKLEEIRGLGARHFIALKKLGILAQPPQPPEQPEYIWDYEKLREKESCKRKA
jgi:hypothetical protein